jgi:hypothetical protein
MLPAQPTRRRLLAGSALLAAGPALAEEPVAPPAGKAEACIFLWMGGGMAQVDTLDPKGRGDGKKAPGCYYATIPTAIPGVRVCEHLAKTAPLLDRAVLLRSLTHGISAEHGAAANFVHTGRMPNETIQYPSLGSVVLHQKGPRSGDVPGYVVMGYPNIMREPGFLGPRCGYVYLTQVETGPSGYVRPPDVDAGRQQSREELLSVTRQEFLRRNPGDRLIQEQTAVGIQAFRLAGGPFLKAFDLASEPPAVRQAYRGEFGQRCLLARRLVQTGVRFVEVSYNLNFLNGTGWDTHNEGQLGQHLLIQDLDRSLSTLLLDLEKHRLLDTTLVVVATEFGRPPEFDARGGRGHQSVAFSALLAGGGLRSGRAIGATDELSRKVVERPITIPDFHATLYCALGIRPDRVLMAGTRPVPITDYGRPLRELFA